MLQQKFHEFYSSGSNEDYSLLFIWRNNQSWYLLLRVYLSFYLIFVFLSKITPWEDRWIKGRRLDVGDKILGNNNC